MDRVGKIWHRNSSSPFIPTRSRLAPIFDFDRPALDATGNRGRSTSRCRLGYLGAGNRWQYAFSKYSGMKYALSVVASGSFEVTPEEAFDCSAGVYLG